MSALTRFTTLFSRRDAKLKRAEMLGQLAAIDKSLAVVHFDLNGNIKSANQNFLDVMGYTADEIVGRHHGMFVEPAVREKATYREFWDKLGRGEFDRGTYKRITKDGSEVWIEATYNPIFDPEGKPYMVVKYASNVTERMRESANVNGQIAAIGKSQAVIEFELDGTIITANDNFLQATGYRREEVVGKHHSMFVSAAERASDDYRLFWKKLGLGEFDQGTYKRLTRGGSEIWIEATYNPVFDPSGKPFKVVKYATDVTEKVVAKNALEAAVKQVTVVAASNDLARRIELEGETGLVKELCDTINGMLERMQENTRREQAVAAENLRIRDALDNVTTNVMIADNDRRIIYMNAAVTRMLIDAESDIQEELPDFRVDGLKNQSIDAFHKNPDHQRRMLERLDKTYKTEIKLGGRTFGLIASPVINADGERFGTVVEWRDRTQELRLENEIREREAREREISEENLRIRNALDNVSTNVMIADNDRRITYINRSLFDMFTRAESDLRKDLPQFDVRKVMGTCIDDFHKNPAHQERMISQLRDTYKTQIKVGGRTMSLTVNPIMDEKGQRRGTVVEWMDRKAEVVVEQEIGAAITAANAGDFSRRIRLDDKDGFFHRMSSGFNDLMGGFENGFEAINRTLVALAEGDFTQRIDADYGGSWLELKNSVNTTVDRLSDLLSQVRDTAEDINGASRDIAAGSADLSARTEQQAASLEETASSMEELTAAVRQNSENAEQANQLAVGASDTANRGGDVVRQVVSRMDEITNSSREISEIISVIEGIAFQTNILALNAAVEAARAGEQGRGFAVVAGEVRSLAQRSSSAAKEISKLISNSVDSIDKGSKMVNTAGETMSEIVTAVKRVTDIMGEITAASREQRSGIEQVNDAITHMDQATQQNAALVEESSASAAALTEQAGGLLEAVNAFRFDADASARRPKVPMIDAGRHVARTPVADRAPAANQAAMQSASDGKPAKPAKPAKPVNPAAAADAEETVPAPAAKKVAAGGGGNEHWEEF